MLHFDLMPRLMPDHYCDTLGEAHEEVARRKASPVALDALTRIGRGPYRGYRVFTVSMTFAMDLFADSPSPAVFMMSSRPSRVGPDGDMLDGASRSPSVPSIVSD